MVMEGRFPFGRHVVGGGMMVERRHRCGRRVDMGATCLVEGQMQKQRKGEGVGPTLLGRVGCGPREKEDGRWAPTQRNERGKFKFEFEFKFRLRLI